jgi:hypothetical protein
MTYVTSKNLKPRFIVRIFLCSINAITTTHLLNTSWFSICRAFWSQQNHWTYFKEFLAATNVEVYERIHLHLGYVCVSKSTMPLAIWFITIIPNPWKSIIIYFYGFHHKFPMFQTLFDSIFSMIDWLTKVAYISIMAFH